MIVLSRVDNRLVHGQILETWVPSLKVERIVVADDDSAKSPLARAAMTLAVPSDLPVALDPVASVDWQELAAASERVLVLFRDVGDLARAAAAGLTPERGRRVNLGNVHYAPGRRPVTPSVFLAGAELEQVKALAAQGFEVEARAIPSDAPSGVAELEKRYNGAPSR